jgi:hypothetical protein
MVMALELWSRPNAVPVLAPLSGERPNSPHQTGRSKRVRALFLVSQARLDYLDAVITDNGAQLRLKRAIGEAP